MEERLPAEIFDLIDYDHWKDMGRIQRLDKLNNVIIGIYTQDKLVLSKTEIRIIAGLDRIRRKEVINNWVKPKYDD